MKLTLKHTLTFSLGTPARAVEHVLLTALGTPQQKIERWSIEMPGFAEAAMFRDAYGNRAHLVSQVKPEGELVVTVSGTVETFDRAGVVGRLEYDPMPALFRRTNGGLKADPAIIEGLKDGPDRIALFHEIMGRIYETPGSPAQMQSQGDGTQAQPSGESRKPQDFASGFVGAVRGLGIPSRYITGYLLDDDGKASFHAWGEAWDESLGWIGFDAAANVCPAENYIRIASGLDATSTMPIRAAPVWAEMPAEVVEITEG